MEARAVVVAACVIVASCAHGGRPAADAEPDMRLWASPVIYWEAGGHRDVQFAIENGSLRTVVIAEPDPRDVRIEVFAGPDAFRVCGTSPAREPARGAGRVELAPGARFTVRVDLSEACRDAPPGSYRYELDLRLPQVQDGTVWSGALPTRYGEVLVEARAETPDHSPARREPGAGRGIRGLAERR